MKWKQHYSSPFPLYHLSETCYDGQTFVPRSLDPERAMEGENWRAKRICVSRSIDGAVSSLVDSMSMSCGLVLYVHTIDNLEELFKKDKVYKPSLKQVPDCDATEEYWLKGKAKLRCIGQIQVGYVRKDGSVKYLWYGIPTTMHRFDWRWIERDGDGEEKNGSKEEN